MYTIYKYPWFDVEHVTLRERDDLFKVFAKAVDALIEYLCQSGGSGNAPNRKPSTLPTSNTLKELVVCGLTCPGFSESQKARIIAQLHAHHFGQYASTKGMNITFGGTDEYAANWPFKVLVKKPDVSGELIEVSLPSTSPIQAIY
jgi:hypothetical protein